MKIIACVKYSKDVSEIKVDKDTKELNFANVPMSVSHIDANILEAAVELKEIYGGTVFGLSYGPRRAKDAFWEALAFGLDEIALVERGDDEVCNPALTAFVLAEAINKIGDVDLIVCGEVSNDGFTYQVPPRLAERLDLPLISFARNIEHEASQLIVDRELEDGSQKVRAPLPAVISVTEETNSPRRPTLMEAMKAKKKPLHLWDVEEHLGISSEMLDAKRNLSLVETAGIIMDRKRHKLEGSDLLEVAGRLVDLLVESEVLIEGKK